MHYDRDKREIVTGRVIEVREVIKLRPMECALFELLWASRGSIVSTSELVDVMDRVNDSTIHVKMCLAVYICLLRKKLCRDVKITTHPKKGYSIMLETN